MTAVIGYGNLIDTATLSTTGTWSGSYPIANIKNRFLGIFAQCTSSSGVITMDFGDLVSVGVVGLVGPSLPGDTVFSIDASHNNFGTVVNVSGSQQFDYYGGGDDWFYTFENLDYRYWRISFSASSGPFSIGRVFVGPRWTPELGLSFGAALGREVRTSRTETDGGARFHRSRTSRRTVTGSFDFLTDAEGHEFRYVQSVLDIYNEAVLIWDDTDTSTKRGDRNMLCNLDELDAMEFPYADLRKIGIRMSEIVA